MLLNSGGKKSICEVNRNIRLDLTNSKQTLEIHSDLECVPTSQNPNLKLVTLETTRQRSFDLVKGDITLDDLYYILDGTFSVTTSDEEKLVAEEEDLLVLNNANIVLETTRNTVYNFALEKDKLFTTRRYFLDWKDNPEVLDGIDSEFIWEQSQLVMWNRPSRDRFSNVFNYITLVFYESQETLVYDWIKLFREKLVLRGLVKLVKKFKHGYTCLVGEQILALPEIDILDYGQFKNYIKNTSLLNIRVTRVNWPKQIKSRRDIVATLDTLLEDLNSFEKNSCVSLGYRFRQKLARQIVDLISLNELENMLKVKFTSQEDAKDYLVSYLEFNHRIEFLRDLIRR